MTKLSLLIFFLFQSLQEGQDSNRATGTTTHKMRCPNTNATSRPSQVQFLAILAAASRFTLGYLRRSPDTTVPSSAGRSLHDAPRARRLTPLALMKYDLGAAPDSLPMEHMFLQLRRSPEILQEI